MSTTRTTTFDDQLLQSVLSGSVADSKGGDGRMAKAGEMGGSPLTSTSSSSAAAAAAGGGGGRHAVVEDSENPMSALG